MTPLPIPVVMPAFLRFGAVACGQAYPSLPKGALVKGLGRGCV